ncbi:MAG: restriction endonuclease subunit S [Romboutsia timonensis]|uniref:restriction endonuclease subunit S n=1 Tax=Romboutsia timonensis TaxID=1776391 RepID=UPI002A764CD9|nr:restriction endonuclease subunit S [Romboutsia timonensis]MDY2883435.1 restriction endonuclease subunit S [Romboutsia timonensis]
MEYRYRDASEMKDSGVEWIGKIPKDWTVSRIDKEFNVRNEKVSDKEYPPLSVTKQGILPQLENVAKSDNGDNRKKVCVGDFVINSRADRKGSCGVSIYDGSVSLICNVLTPKKLHPQYVHSLFRNYYFSEEFYRWGSGIVDDLWSTNIEKMKKINIPIPMGEEDEKIADFLDKKTLQFDSIISKKEALIEKLEEAKKSLISEVVTGKVKVVKTDDGYELVKRSSDEMKDSGIEWLGEIPKDWEIKRLRFLGKLQNGISKASDQFGFGYPFVSYSNVYRNINLPENIEGLVNSTDEERKIYSVEEGDVFFTRTSETVEEIGFASTCMETIQDATFAGFLIRFRPNSNRLYKGFSKYYFRCDLNRKYFVKEMNLVTRASLSQNLLNNLAVVLPSYKEQIDIYNTLELKIGGVNLSIDKLKYQIEKLKEAKQSLISEAVTGKIEVLN